LTSWSSSRERYGLVFGRAYHVVLDTSVYKSLINRGGPDAADNAVSVCKSCNSRKGSRRLYEWYGLESRNDVPRVVEGKLNKWWIPYQFLQIDHMPMTGTGKMDKKVLWDKIARR